MATCPIHGREFVQKQGNYGPWWACSSKLPDGSWCRERPPKAYSPRPAYQAQLPPPVGVSAQGPAGPSPMLLEAQKQTRLLEEMKMLMSTLVHRTPPTPAPREWPEALDGGGTPPPGYDGEQ